MMNQNAQWNHRQISIIDKHRYYQVYRIWIINYIPLEDCEVLSTKTECHFASQWPCNWSPRKVFHLPMRPGSKLLCWYHLETDSHQILRFDKQNFDFACRFVEKIPLQNPKMFLNWYFPAFCPFQIMYIFNYRQSSISGGKLFITACSTKLIKSKTTAI